MNQTGSYTTTKIGNISRNFFPAIKQLFERKDYPMDITVDQDHCVQQPEQQQKLPTLYLVPASRIFLMLQGTKNHLYLTLNVNQSKEYQS
mmetsp:Transcript_33627/g.34129  ORF Transcript_33627/g.34129 Transcript_33627/m.34129 type:complete len:90 (+) Transcript_33627:510-779(+)